MGEGVAQRLRQWRRWRLQVRQQGPAGSAALHEAAQAKEQGRGAGAAAAAPQRGKVPLPLQQLAGHKGHHLDCQNGKMSYQIVMKTGKSTHVLFHFINYYVL